MPYLRPKKYSLFFTTTFAPVEEEEEEEYENVCSLHLGCNSSLTCTACLIDIISREVSSLPERSTPRSKMIHPFRRTEVFYKTQLTTKNLVLCNHCCKSKDLCLSEAKHEKWALERQGRRRRRFSVFSACM